MLAQETETGGNKGRANRRHPMGNVTRANSARPPRYRPVRDKYCHVRATSRGKEKKKKREREKVTRLVSTYGVPWAPYRLGSLATRYRERHHLSPWAEITRNDRDRSTSN